MNYFKKNNENSEYFFKNIFTLAKGAILARIIGFLSIPILTRTYTPEDYGILALYVSLISILAPMLTLRYVQAIPLPKSDVLAMSLFTISTKLIFIGTIILSCILVFFGRPLLGIFNMGILASFWPLISLGVAGTAFYELITLWATRKKKFKDIAISQINQSLIGSLVKIGLGLLSFKAPGLIIGQFFSQSGGIVRIFKGSLSDWRFLLPKVSLSKEKLVFMYYLDFLKYRFPSQILMVLSLQAPIVMMASLFDKDETGQLSLALMTLSLPASLIGSAIAKAYYAEIASIGKRNIKKIKDLTFKLQIKLFMIGVPITIVAMLISEFMFSFIFGNEWVLAGRFAAVLAPFILFQLTSSPLMEVINITGSQIFFLILHSVRICILCLLFVISSVYDVSPYDFVILLTITLSAFYLVASLSVLVNLKRQVV